MTTDTQAILEKIKKLLALSKSPNEHEAALALQKAQVLMERYSITEEAIQTIDIGEADTPATVKRSPARWEMGLVRTIRRAFGCDSFLDCDTNSATWVFIGSGPAPEIAAYVFQTLCRQVVKARKDYLATLKRCKPKTKTERGNIFCEAWVSSVDRRIVNFAGHDRTEAIVAYKATKHPDLTTLTPRGKNIRLNSRNEGAYAAGIVAGHAAQLHHGVGTGREAPTLIGGSYE